MAENKKSFVLYADLIHTVSKMPNDKAGELFKHILEYVNDLNPKTEDLIIKLTFEPIKQQLKRDLRKYESKKKQWSKAGKRSAEVRNAKKNERTLTDVESRSTDLTVNDNVNDNVNVSVNVNDNVKKEINSVFNFRKSLLALGVDKNLADDWIKVRKTKRATNTETAFKILKKQLDLCKLDNNAIIEKCVVNSWSGFKSEWLENTQQKKTKRTL